MPGYIYSVREHDDFQLDIPGQTRIQTTRKYEAKEFLRDQLTTGVSLSEFEVTRSRDGKADTTHVYDTYMFMDIDQGEVE